MFNPTEVVIDAFEKRLRDAYLSTYSNLEPSYPGIISFVGGMALEIIANSDAPYHDLNHTICVTLVGQEILKGKHLREGGVSPQDWLQFTATAGVTYTLVTANTGGHADTVLYLYAIDGRTLVNSNDDDPDNWPASRLEWGALRDGAYYVKIEHWDPNAYGCTTDYDLSISETGNFEVPSGQIFLPFILRNRP